MGIATLLRERSLIVGGRGGAAADGVRGGRGHAALRRAAERLGVAQPAVSQLIRRLEEQLGVTLFERTSHRVTITPAGEQLLPDARSAVATVRRSSTRASELAAGTAGSLRDRHHGGDGGPARGLLRRYGEAQPAVELDLQVLPTEQKLANLAAGTLDVAFLRSTPAVTPGWPSGAWRERFVAVLPAAHPAAATAPARRRRPGGAATDDHPAVGPPGDARRAAGGVPVDRGGLAGAPHPAHATGDAGHDRHRRGLDLVHRGSRPGRCARRGGVRPTGDTRRSARCGSVADECAAARPRVRRAGDEH